MGKNKTNLHECFCSGVKPELAYEYEFYINDNTHNTRNKIITGEELHQMAGTSSDTHFIRMKTQKGKILVGPKVNVDLTECGIERFIIRPYRQETIDLHDCFCEGVNPVITFKYLIKVNRDKYEVEQEKISGKEIIELLGKDPQTHSVRMFSKGGKVLVKNDEYVDLTECGVERFVIMPLECREGFINDARIKQLQGEDKKFLDELDFQVEFLKEGNLDWLVIRDYQLPRGYNLEKTDVAIYIPSSYPVAQLDMIYFHPSLNRIDNKPIGALSSKSIEGKNYQRWSRHRTTSNRWNPEVDNIESHLDMMMNCLVEEFKKR